MVSHRARAPSSSVRGDLVSAVSCVIPAILPISVCIPVRTTTPVALPDATVVPVYAMLSRSASTERSLIALLSFPWGVDSPVSEKSFVLTSNDSMILMSAGILSPASSCTMSPGTSWFWGVSRTSPSRMTFAGDVIRFLRLSRILLTLYSWTKPIIALIETIATITAPSR